MSQYPGFRRGEGKQRSGPANDGSDGQVLSLTDANNDETQWVDAAAGGGIPKLSDYANFAAALTDIGDNGQLIIDVNETLDEVTSYVVPFGLTLYGGGGILTAAAGTSCLVYGPVVSNVQIFDYVGAASLGRMDLIIPTVNPRWFGMLDGSESSDGAANTTAIINAFVAGGKRSGNQNGSNVLIQGPTQYFARKIIFTDEPGGGQRILRGDGMRNAKLILESGQDTGLVEALGITPFFFGSFQELWFQGQPTATAEPLVRCSSYGAGYMDCSFTSHGGAGLQLETGNNVRIERCNFQQCDIGLHIKGSAKAAIVATNIDAEQNRIGLWIDGTDHIDQSRGGVTIVDGFYSEQNATGILLTGVGNTIIRGITTASDGGTDYLVHLDNFDAGGGVTRPCTGNKIILDGAFSIAGAVPLKVRIEEGCFGNTFYYPAEANAPIIFEDMDGRNNLVAVANSSAIVSDTVPEVPPSFCNILNLDTTNPRISDLNTAAGSTLTLGDAFAGNPAANYQASENKPTSGSITTLAPTGTNWLSTRGPVDMPADDYWYNVLIYSDVATLVEIEFIDGSANRYDHSQPGTWWSPGVNTEFVNYPVWIQGGKPQWVSVPLKLTEVRTVNAQVNVRYLPNAEIRFQYAAFADKKGAGMIHKDLTGDITGSGDFYTKPLADLPPAGALPLATEVWESGTQKPFWAASDAWTSVDPLAYSFPEDTGEIDEVLKTDGSGITRWLAVDRSATEPIDFWGKMVEADSEYVVITNNTDQLLTDNFTVSAWYYVEQHAGQVAGIFTRLTGSLGYGWAIHSGILAFMAHDGTFNRVAPSSGNPSDGAWHHVAAVMNAGQLTLYVDNVFQGSSSQSIGDANVDTSIGLFYGNNTGFRLNGQVGDCHLYNRPLTASEISALFATNPPADPVSEYLFTDQAGTTLTDTGTATNNGTLTGFADPATFWQTWTPTGVMASGFTGAAKQTINNLETVRQIWQAMAADSQTFLDLGAGATPEQIREYVAELAQGIVDIGNIA